MERYEVYLHIGLLEAVPKAGYQRKLIMDFIRGLRDRPRTEGDYADRDRPSVSGKSRSSVITP